MLPGGWEVPGGRDSTQAAWRVFGFLQREAQLEMGGKGVGRPGAGCRGLGKGWLHTCGLPVEARAELGGCRGSAGLAVLPPRQREHPLLVFFSLLGPHPMPSRWTVASFWHSLTCSLCPSDPPTRLLPVRGHPFCSLTLLIAMSILHSSNSYSFPHLPLAPASFLSLLSRQRTPTVQALPELPTSTPRVVSVY